jgi:hypothetical protein
MSGWEVDLREGRPAVVSATTVMCALLHAGVDCRRYAFGGADWGKVFVLDEYDRLTEYVEE